MTGSQLSSRQVDRDIRSDTDQPAREGPAGLRGWLILPLLGLAITPVVTTILHWETVSTYADVWQYLSIPQKAFGLTELVVIALVFLVMPAVLLFLAFKKLQIFPPLYVIWICALPVVLLVDGFATLWVFEGLLSSEDVFDRETTRDITRSVVQAAIWGLYMYRSERVENTFVN